MTGAELLELRKRLGWSQERLAEELRTTQPTVSRWERSERSISGPARALLERLAQERAA